MGLLDEERFPMAARHKLGIRRTADTLKRWHHEGLVSRRTKRRVYLEALYEGNELVTSREAVKRFLAALNRLPAPGASPP